VISVRAFLDGVASIVDERPTYRLGMDGTGRLCDCIGLVIGGIRRAGGTWTGTHGSNWAARNAVDILPEHYLQEGMVALKSRGPGEAGYNLPAQYAGHPDKRDYYHVGVVTSVHPLEITHCTSWAGGGGIKRDTSLGNWKHFWRLKNVAYTKDEDMEPAETRIAEVYADSGSTVNMRSSPSRNGAVVKKIPIGDSVAVLDDDSAANWVFVEHGDKRGWVMSDYMKTEEEASPMTAQELARAIFQTIEAYL
jgi:hypothetical protein